MTYITSNMSVFMYDGVEFMMMTKVELYLFKNYKIVFIFDYI